LETVVVNMRTSAWDVAIDRSSPFGNPYRLGKDGDRRHVLEKYKEYFLRRVESDPEFRRRVLALRGKRLGCHCAPQPCHGMIIVEWLTNQAE
jgi:hypothetical protein